MTSKMNKKLAGYNKSYRNFHEAWTNAKDGDKLKYGNDCSRYIIKSSCTSGFKDADGYDYLQHHFFDNEWHVYPKKKTTTITTETGREVEISIESAEKLNLM